MTPDQEQGAWRVIYISILNWNYHPKGVVLSATEIGNTADRELMRLKAEEDKRWPDGQQQHK